MRDFLTEYAAGAPDLAACFARTPTDLFKEAPTISAWDRELTKAVARYQSRFGKERNFDGAETVVATGQQPGLLTGPLYTIYKAVTAIRLAARLEERFKTRCVPIFWLASDDHDFEEARITHVLTKRHEPLPLRYEPQGEVSGRPLHRVPAEESLHDVIRRAATETPGAEFRSDVETFLHDSLDAADSFADWTGRLLARLFKDTPLVVFAPHLPEARQVAAEVFEQEIACPLASTRLLNEAGRRLESLGFPPQIAKTETQCNFFIEVEGRRRKVFFENERYRAPEENLDLSMDDMFHLLREAPERFSPNVALRCIVQQHLFPIAAYVAGPSEIAYWAQLRPLFDHFGQPMPIVYPRARCTLFTTKTRQLMSKLGLALDDFAGADETLIERALRAMTRPSGAKAIRRRRRAVHNALAGLSEDLSQHDPTAAAMAGNLDKHVAEQLDRLERTMLRSDKARLDAARKQVARLRNTLCPWRKPQERVYTIVSFLFEHGWGLIQRLIAELDIESSSMNEVEL
ncbi:MAG TPA: bacillithiol biosynthesis cysteine-adding enzyme BshC [Candidatus Hydrogenedentes bacterium]|nr:bacillithiol biosynthesis cysteine-adding enzyme BshC [Candidatus Hydrogenedentota bacterium]HIJ74582.1 bacillithiol biosynthesis cysteine-adding enzyme BshC [Candidatus Hydrogenedentota bacterium]